MIQHDPNPHRAFYDEHGNIVIPRNHAAKETEEHGISQEQDASPPALEAVAHAPDRTPDEQAMPLLLSTRATVYDLLHSLRTESARQYRVTWRRSSVLGRSAASTVLMFFRSSFAFLTQPVFLPTRHSRKKQANRIVLFLLDTVRFGGTFAALFAVLFVSLNYRSFWEITQSYIAPIGSAAGGTDNDVALQYRLSRTLKRLPSLPVAGGSTASFLSLLPPAGPPQNRLIIPSIDINVPIVQPDNSALLAEDWKRLEANIQTSLQDGVVHYPGTARPGQAGNFFVTGHSSYFPWASGKFKSVFARLGELKVGDEYWVYFGGDLHRYRVQSRQEISPSDVSVLDQPVRKRMSTLMTCTPVGTTLRRLIISAQEIDPVSGEPLNVGERGSPESLPQIKASELPI